MTTDNNPAVQTSPHTAISTWSGFVYQGKVALLHCLKLITDSFKDVESYKLQLDSIDDFAILDNNNVCRSMHQVKAYKEPRFSKYRVDIEEQQSAADSHPQAAVYFHVSKSITNIPDDFINSYSPVTLYEYNKSGVSECFCGLNEINTLIETQISCIYRQHYSPSVHKLENTYLVRSRNFLEDIVVNKVINIHHQIQESPNSDQRDIAFRENIDFGQLFEKLDTELSAELLSEDYFFHVIRKHTGEYFKEYCDDFVDEDTISLKLNLYISQINLLSKEGLKQFISAILPHKKGCFDTLRQFKDSTFDGEDFKNGLFYILEKLTLCQPGIQGLHPSIFYWQNSNDNYYPTAIRESQRLTNRYCKQIIEASMEDDLDFLYESGCLVTVDMDCSSIFDAIATGPNAQYEEDHKNYHKLRSFKNVSLISLANTETILND